MDLLCRYYGRYSTKLPDDFPAPVRAAIDAVCTAVAVLRAYDEAHQGGRS